MAQAKSYKQLSEDLAKIMDWFQGDNVDLDQAIAKYEQASAIIQQMEKYLKTAENKIRKITAKDKA